MRLSSPYLMLLGVALVACKEGDESSLDTYNTSASTSTGTESSGDDVDEVDTDTDTDTGETGDPEDYEGLRYLVIGTENDLLISINLDDPLDVPEPQVIVSGTGTVAFFGPTPDGGEIVAHEDRVDRMYLRETADYDFNPLASLDSAWLDRAWFDADVTHAIMAVGQMTLGVTNQLLWVSYNGSGEVSNVADITPPIDANGAVLVPEISTDKRWAAVLVDVELDSTWHLYALNLDPQPNIVTYIDELDLAGLPPSSVGDFVWLDIHPNRISYRKELQPGIFSPVAVALDDPAVTNVNLAPNLNHINSMMWSPDQTKLLVSAGGTTGYRQLYLIEVLEDTMAQDPILITEVGSNARVDTSVIDFATIGHGFDNLGRIWYAYTDSMLPEPVSVGVNLVVVADGDVVQRTDLIEPYPGLEVDEVVFDAEHQLLGFRAQSTSFGGSIYYADMTQAPVFPVQIDQQFVHDELIPFDDVNFAIAPDGSRIVMAGVQDGMTTLHVSQIGDSTGATVEVTLPEVESAPGIILDHKPRISPDGEQAILWYRAQDGRTGLVHAPLDAEAEGRVVLGLQQPLVTGTFLQHLPE
jgi:hypothetical protein